MGTPVGKVLASVPSPASAIPSLRLPATAVLWLAVWLAGCADIDPTPSSNYDGVYELMATPLSVSSEEACAPFMEKVVVRNGRLAFTTHGVNRWQGVVDADGVWHGESAFGGRTFRLADGIDVPGVIGMSSDDWCQWRYRFRREGP
jgi:hypothetical protein